MSLLSGTELPLVTEHLKSSLLLCTTFQKNGVGSGIKAGATVVAGGKFSW